MVSFDGELWEHQQGGWHFVSVPLDLSDQLRAEHGARAGGFGSIKVEVTIGATSWRTSIFPSKGGEYVLPVKQQVRRAEDLHDGATAAVSLVVL